jgi:membrane fusion protein, multidrug efflux system
MSNLTTEVEQPVIQRTRRRGRVRTWLISLTLIALCGVGAWFWIIQPHLQQVKASTNTRRAASSQAVPVGVATVNQGDLQIIFRGLGTVTPLATVTVRTQISGRFMEVGFQEGQRVKKGDFLAQIDPQIYQAQLEQAQGQLQRDQAQLANAKLDLTRYQKLNSQDSVARQTLDTQRATVQQDEGIVQNDQGLVDSAKVNLAYCRIEAPVDGKVGLRQVDPGNYVQPGDTNGLVVLTQMQPMSVIFTLPEDDASAVIKRLHAGAKLGVQAYDRSDTTLIASGTLDTMDNQIDTSTGTVKLRASFPNENEELFPNQFVNARLLVDTLQNVTLLPVAAVQQGTPGAYVYLVNPDSSVSVQVVKLGSSDGQNYAVTSGVSPGDQVVVDGVDRLRDGAKITIPSSKPDSPNPTSRQDHSGGHRRHNDQSSADAGTEKSDSSPGAQWRHRSKSSDSATGSDSANASDSAKPPAETSPKRSISPQSSATPAASPAASPSAG